MDNSSVAYAAIAIKGSNKGTFSNAEGQFSVACQSGDSLIISAVGYKQQICSCHQEKIYLDTSAVRLQEVVIRPASKTVTRKSGYFNKKNEGGYVGFNALLCFIENKKKERCLLKKVNFSLYKSWLFDWPLSVTFRPLLVRLLIYDVKPSGAPGYSILAKNITATVAPAQKKVSFDVSSLGLDFPSEGIFIGIEFLGYYADGNFTPFSSEDKNKFLQYQAAYSHTEELSRSWVRTDYGNKWDCISGHEPTRNFNFGIEAACY